MAVFLGEIRMFAGSTPPLKWAFCNGQLLLIVSYPDLYGLIGTRYGGDGITTFALPDMRGRFPMNMGSNGGYTYNLGNTGGQEKVTLSIEQIPEHTHVPRVNTGGNPVNDPTGRVWTGWTGAQYSTQGVTAGATMSSAVLDSIGGGQEHENRPPYLAINFIIALDGWVV